ncbi:MAG: SDR family oxidoreductase [Ruegeria sp.]
MDKSKEKAKNILVLGAYGFIGAAVVRSLRDDKHKVTGMARDLHTGQRVLPGIDLIQGDLRHLCSAEDWTEVLASVDVVVNCAGALQDGPEDDLEAVHHRSIAALAKAAAQLDVSIVQISAIGAVANASTAFMRTKAAGDAALQTNDARLWIFKPGLVIGQSDYGGTALLRMLAAVPLIQPLAYPTAPVQGVGLDDVCRAIKDAVRDELPHGSYDLVEDTPHQLEQVVSATRHWLGFPAARAVIAAPSWLIKAVATGADLLGHLGWRSPLRTTAMSVMAQGVVGDPARYRKVSGRSLAPLNAIYENLVCARENRMTARIGLLMPIVIASLSLFWVVSGVLGLFNLALAADVLTRVGWSVWIAKLSVVFWSFVDIALGLAVLWRPWVAHACLAQVAVAAFYLLSATIVTPTLWADPLGPLVKIIPILMLSLTARAMLDSR